MRVKESHTMTRSWDMKRASFGRFWVFYQKTRLDEQLYRADSQSAPKNWPEKVYSVNYLESWPLPHSPVSRWSICQGMTGLRKLFRSSSIVTSYTGWMLNTSLWFSDWGLRYVELGVNRQCPPSPSPGPGCQWRELGWWVFAKFSPRKNVKR